MAENLRNVLEQCRTCKVNKLTEKNYTHWKKEMMMHLKNAGLWVVISGDIPEGPARDEAWDTKNDRAWSDIYGACESNQQEFIID